MDLRGPTLSLVFPAIESRSSAIPAIRKIRVAVA